MALASVIVSIAVELVELTSLYCKDAAGVTSSVAAPQETSIFAAVTAAKVIPVPGTGGASAEHELEPGELYCPSVQAVHDTAFCELL
jgi:hypothetical protein